MKDVAFSFNSNFSNLLLIQIPFLFSESVQVTKLRFQAYETYIKSFILLF